MPKSADNKNNDKAIYIILALILALVIAIGLFLFRNIENMNRAKFEVIVAKINQLENKVQLQNVMIKNLKISNKRQPKTEMNSEIKKEENAKTIKVYNALINSPKVFAATNNLRSAINKGAPFINELQTVTTLLPNLVRAFEPIKPMAITGVITINQLNNQLTAIVAKNKIAVNENWKGEFLNKLNSLVEVQKTSDNIEVKIAHIKTLLTTNDLKQAYDEAKKLNVPGLTKWLHSLSNLILVANTLQVNSIYLLRSMIIAEEMKP